ncbi:hypothetical protein ACJMK2_009115 [Sinanodonta woodiana]|uniref:Uncharacterized protein n=1 Tax=Sinanodonta woodiana TaxID=1069815 RepID=A0ABD3VCG4_SINWO
MTLLTITLLVGLGVLVSGFPVPIGHGADIFSNHPRGHALHDVRGPGNLDFGHGGSLYNGPSPVLARSVGNNNGRLISIGNRANINHGPGILTDQFGGHGWNGYSNIGNGDFGHAGSGWDSLHTGSADFNSGRGISSGNRANVYDVNGIAAKGPAGKVSGDIFRSYAQDGIEIGGFIAFE